MKEIEYEPMKRPYGTSYNPYSKWQRILKAAADYIREHEGRVFTVRYIYYRLIAKAIMKFGATTYESWIKAVTRARKDFTNENFEALIKMVDDTRTRHSALFFDEPTEKDAIKEIQSLFRPILDPWDTRVEIWVEKSTLFTMYENIAREYRLTMQSLRGNLTVRAAFEAYARLREEDRDIVILYLGDLNPAGERRPYNVKAALTDLGLDVDIYKIVVNPSDVIQYNLIPAVEEYGKRLRKARRDPNVDWFREVMGGKMYNVDVEAMEIETVDELLKEALTDILGDIDETMEETRKKEQKIADKVQVKKTDYGFRVEVD